MRAGADSSPWLRLAALLILFAALAVADRKPAAEAVIAGSVHRDTGFAMGGADVTVVPNPEDPAAKKPKGSWRTSTNQRGEFAVRVPAGRMRYNVIVKAGGYRTGEKPVIIGADERAELSFILEPAVKP